MRTRHIWAEGLRSGRELTRRATSDGWSRFLPRDIVWTCRRVLREQIDFHFSENGKPDSWPSVQVAMWEWSIERRGTEQVLLLWEVDTVIQLRRVHAHVDQPFTASRCAVFDQLAEAAEEFAEARTGLRAQIR